MSPVAPGTLGNSHKKIVSFLRTCTVCEKATLMFSSVFMPEWKVRLISFLGGKRGIRPRIRNRGV